MFVCMCGVRGVRGEKLSWNVGWGGVLTKRSTFINMQSHVLILKFQIIIYVNFFQLMHVHVHVWIHHWDPEKCTSGKF